MSIKTVTTWQTVPNDSDFDAERSAWLAQAIVDGKTTSESGTVVQPEPLVSERTWVDQSAANEWKTFIEALATKYGCTATVTF